VAGRSFRSGAEDLIIDELGHSTPLSRILALQAPSAKFVVAKVFDQRLITDSATVTEGIRWLVEQKVSIINMSFGQRKDRQDLREACLQAQAAGCILLGASPAQGASVFPSDYPGVVRVTGDARCTPGVFSHLDSIQADIGACAYWCKEDQERLQIGGASFAVPYVAGRLAQLLANGVSRERLWSHFLSECRYQGPEIKN
jgi:Subtilase family